MISIARCAREARKKTFRRRHQSFTGSKMAAVRLMPFASFAHPLRPLR